MRSRRQETPAISLFPFLAVLVAAMGALILLLLVITHQAERMRENEARAKLEQLRRQLELAPLTFPPLEEYPDVDLPDWVDAPAPLEPLPPLADPRSALVAQRDALTQQLNELQAKLAGSGTKTTQTKLDVLAEQIAALVHELARLRADAKQLEQLLAGDREVLETLARERQRLVNQPIATNRFAILPYVGASGTRHRPIFLECDMHGVLLQPENIRVTNEEMAEDFHSPANPLVTMVRAVILEVGLDASQGTPYPLFVVRPDGIETYYLAKKCLRHLPVRTGYELVGQEIDLEYGESSEHLSHVAKQAIAMAKASARRDFARTPQGQWGGPRFGEGVAGVGNVNGSSGPNESGGTADSGLTPGTLPIEQQIAMMQGASPARRKLGSVGETLRARDAARERELARAEGRDPHGAGSGSGSLASAGLPQVGLGMGGAGGLGGGIDPGSLDDEDPFSLQPGGRSANQPMGHPGAGNQGDHSLPGAAESLAVGGSGTRGISLRRAEPRFRPSASGPGNPGAAGAYSHQPGATSSSGTLAGSRGGAGESSAGSDGGDESLIFAGDALGIGDQYAAESGNPTGRAGELGEPNGRTGTGAGASEDCADCSNPGGTASTSNSRSQQPTSLQAPGPQSAAFGAQATGQTGQGAPSLSQTVSPSAMEPAEDAAPPTMPNLSWASPPPPRTSGWEEQRRPRHPFDDPPPRSRQPQRRQPMLDLPHGTTTFSKPVAVVCYADRLVFVDSGETVFLPRDGMIGHTALDRLANLIQTEVSLWDDPPPGARWRPRLVLKTLPEGIRTAAGLRFDLAGLIEIEQELVQQAPPIGRRRTLP